MIIDPFGGVALGAADALANGIHFIGIELERFFVDMGAGCDCAGISKADWVRCFGRWKRFAHRDGRHWCPRCLAQAGQIIEERKAPKPDQAQAKRRARMRELMAETGRKVDFNLYALIPFPESRNRSAEALRLFGAEQLVTSYRRNSGKIPYSEPHRYTGNLELFARHARDGATAMLVQGDSRRLCEVLEGARAEGIIASPPFTDTHSVVGVEAHSRQVTAERVKTKIRYGTDPAQLGNLPTGEPPSAVISSPPLGKAQSGGTAFWEGLEKKHDRKFSDRVREGSQGYREDQLGNSDGQLGTMPTGKPPQIGGDVDAVIASPPFLEARSNTTKSKAAGHGGRADVAYADLVQDYGDTNGQLAQMREGEPPQGIISSPPYVSGGHHDGVFSTWGGQADKQGGCAKWATKEGGYGEGEDNLGNMKGGEPPAGIVSSPPWYGSTAEDKASRSESYWDFKTGHHKHEKPGDAYAEGTTSLYNELRYMSPEWLECRKETAKLQGNLSRLPPEAKDPDYPTFWSAARTIVSQCYQVLAPGGHAIFVTKRFVRGGKIVQFSQQWADLCQSCGFELMEWIKAWLIEERETKLELFTADTSATMHKLNGESKRVEGENFEQGRERKKVVKRFSFFRRLHAQKYPHLAIEWEDVLIFRKPSNAI